MEKLILYHGTDHIIKKPQLGLGKIHNDFGQGFYCTEDIDLGKEWARQENNEQACVNKYELYVNNLKILDLEDEENEILKWITILVEKRYFDELFTNQENYQLLLKNYKIDTSKYDVIIGYRADDSYFNFVQLFLNNTISVESLNHIMRLGNLGRQVVLLSGKAFAELKYIETIPAEEKYYNAYINREELANKNAFAYLNTNKNIKNETFLLDALRGDKKL